MRSYDENASIQRRQCIYSSLSSSSASSSATWGHCVVVGHVREINSSCRRIDRSCCSCYVRSSPLSVKSARVHSQSHADTTSNKIVSLLTSRVLHRCQHLNRSVSFDSHSTWEVKNTLSYHHPLSHHHYLQSVSASSSTSVSSSAAAASSSSSSPISSSFLLSRFLGWNLTMLIQCSLGLVFRAVTNVLGTTCTDVAVHVVITGLYNEKRWLSLTCVMNIQKYRTTIICIDKTKTEVEFTYRCWLSLSRTSQWETRKLVRSKCIMSYETSQKWFKGSTQLDRNVPKNTVRAKWKSNIVLDDTHRSFEHIPAIQDECLILVRKCVLCLLWGFQDSLFVWLYCFPVWVDTGVFRAKLASEL